MKAIVKLLFFLLVIISLSLLLIRFVPAMRHHENLNPSIISLLIQLGDSALQTNDVPVASIILYKNQIISKGYNTVLKDNNIAGHAEINAINNLLNKTGIDSFHKISHSLTLISTWEPCPMCTSAIIQSDIENVIILKPKSLRYKLREEKKWIFYQWRKQTIQNDTVQMNLFRKHPLYNNQDTSIL